MKRYAFLIAAMVLTLIALVLPSRQQPPTAVNVVTDSTGAMRTQAQTDSILDAQPRDATMVAVKLALGLAALVCFGVGVGAILKDRSADHPPAPGPTNVVLPGGYHDPAPQVPLTPGRPIPPPVSPPAGDSSTRGTR